MDSDPGAWVFESEKGTPLNYASVYGRRIQQHYPRSARWCEFPGAAADVGCGVERGRKGSQDPGSDRRYSVDVSENEYRQANVDLLREAAKRLGERLQ